MSKMFFPGSGLRWAGAVLLLAVLAGCATHKIDWAGRVGHFTYDQAVIELGPPDKQAKLGDGTVVADWLLQRGRNYTYVGSGYANPGYYRGPLYPDYVATSSPDYFLRLTFSPNGQLQSWKKFMR